MKKLIKIIVCLLVVMLLIPIKSICKDGGTKVYNAILYDVYDFHRIYDYDGQETKYIEGKIIVILGIEVYNNTNPRITIN